MIKRLSAIVGLAALALVVAAPAAHAQLTTSTLATQIDNINGTFVDYFTVVLTNYWPFVVGALILVGVFAFAIRLVLRLVRGG